MKRLCFQDMGGKLAYGFCKTKLGCSLKCLAVLRICFKCILIKRQFQSLSVPHTYENCTGAEGIT